MHLLSLCMSLFMWTPYKQMIGPVIMLKAPPEKELITGYVKLFCLRIAVFVKMISLFFLNFVPLLCVDRDSSVGIATRYDLGGPGIECRLGRVSPHPSGPVFGSTQPPVQWLLSLFSEGEASGIWRWPPPPDLAPWFKK
jgi:hypothetical protein